MSGGLLGQCVLAIDDRDIDLCPGVRDLPERIEGPLLLEEGGEFAVL
jgi:hypothetical protein